MCIIVYKPANTPFPKKKTLKTCFENNSDGAGFMYAVNDKVYIEKGFMGFTSFNKALKRIRLQHGDDIPYVLHFRISTQAGIRPDCCHPYPLSRNMKDLRKLNCETDIGIAHNGIIDLTSDSYYSKVKPDYNDTMKFITDYLSLIISGRTFYKNKDTVTLIERLADSKLAILDGSGRCTLIGDFIKDDGIYYSNTHYKPYEAITTKPYDKSGFQRVTTPHYSKYYEDDDYIDMYNCGYENYGTFSMCEECFDKNTCPMYVEGIRSEADYERYFG